MSETAFIWTVLRTRDLSADESIISKSFILNVAALYIVMSYDRVLYANLVLPGVYLSQYDSQIIQTYQITGSVSVYFLFSHVFNYLLQTLIIGLHNQDAFVCLTDLSNLNDFFTD